MSTEILSPIAMVGWIARGMALASKRPYDGGATTQIMNLGAPRAVIERLKSPVGAGSMSNNDLGSYGISLGAWSDSLRTRSVFYRLLADNAFTRAPLRTRVGLVTSTASGSVVGEGYSVPVSRIALSNVLLEPTKVGALVVCTDELLRDISPAGQNLFNRELAGAISDAVDLAFLDLIISTGTSSTPSAGVTAVNAKHDLRTALLSVDVIGVAKPYWICSVDVARKASTLADTAGLDAFPAMTATGGEMAGLPCVVSSGVPSGELVLIDATGVVADADTVQLAASTQADIQMDSGPGMSSTTPTGAQMTSLFQTNSAALRATAYFGAQVLRDNAVHITTGIDWGGP